MVIKTNGWPAYLGTYERCLAIVIAQCDYQSMETSIPDQSPYVYRPV